MGNKLYRNYEITKNAWTQPALDQYQEWCQCVDWEKAISDAKPATYIHLHGVETILPRDKLAQWAWDDYFTARAHEYVSKMCREKYNVSCGYLKGGTTYVSTFPIEKNDSLKID